MAESVKRVRVDNIVGSPDLAEVLGVSYGHALKTVADSENNGFPEPFAVVGKATALYERNAVEKWRKDNPKKGRLSKEDKIAKLKAALAELENG